MVVAGRRFGKTVLGINELLYWCQKFNKANVWYVAPTYRMAKEILWDQLKDAVPPDMVESINEAELSIKIRGYSSKICLKGADNPDSLRGMGLHFVVFDEFADMDKSVWFKVIYPALTDNRGSALFIGTPKGYNWAYDLAMYAMTAKNWSYHQYTTEQGGNVSPEELEYARNTMSKKHYDQEFNASFETLSNRVYFTFDRKYNVDESVADIGTEIHVGMDFNVNPMSCTLSSKVGDQLHTFDEIGIENANTEEMGKELRGRYPSRKIIVYPDPSGKSRKTSAVVGRTDFTILREFGFEVLSPNKAPAVVDRVNEVNALHCNSKDYRRSYIHPRCKNLIKGFEGLTYKEGTSQPDKTSGLDHFPDGYGYKVHYLFPIGTGKSETVSVVGL